MPQIVDIRVRRQARQPTSNGVIRVGRTVGAQRERSAMSPHGLRGGAQVPQPGERLTSMRAIVERVDEGVKIVAYMHGHLRLGKDAPYRTWQILVTHLRDPAPPGVVNRQRHAGPEYALRLFRKGASGKINRSKFSLRETGASLE